jgi:large subunit ribosomal protein L6
MSRIGNQPVLIPQNVEVKIDKNQILVKGPKGSVKQIIRPEINLAVEGDKILVSRKNNNKFSRSLHGLTRSLIANMILGVTEGFSKALKMVGTGYRVEMKDGKLVLAVGFSHPVIVEKTEGIDFEVQGRDKITVSGVDKGLVGQVAAEIRAIRPPEPYKGKGIRYEGEEVKKKPGKAGKVGVGGFGAEGG